MSEPIASPYDAFLSLEKWRSLPRASRERAIAEHALRGILHSLLDPCPQIDRLGGQDIFERFVTWADHRRLSLGWRAHLHLLSWLTEDEVYRDRVADEHLIEAMAAAASRWAMLDRGPGCGVVIGCRLVRDRLVVGWKCRSPEEGKQIELVSVEDLEAPEGLTGYFIVPGFELDEYAPWIPG